MSLRTRARSALCAMAVTAVTTVSLAQASNARARMLMSEALEEDYLATDFAAAADKLKAALAICTADAQCSPQLRATIHRARGIVFASGLDQNDEAIEAFRQMILADKTLKLDDNYTTDAIQKAYDAALRAVEQSAPPEVVPFEEAPWKEQAKGTPIPVFVKASAEVKLAKVVFSFKAKGSADWSDVTLERRGEGYGGYIPCAAVQAEGEVTYFVTGFDSGMRRVAAAGTEEAPRTVVLRTAISGRQPTLPGGTPPQACPRPESERLNCDVDDDCPGNQMCEHLFCVAAREPVVEPVEEIRAPQNWLSLGFSPDVVFMSATSDACSPSAQEGGQRGCFYSGGQQFSDQPLADGKSNTIASGFAPGSMRALLSYDRVVGQRFTVGATAGFAFLGQPDHATGGSFFPGHAAARAAFFFGSDPFADTGVRPYVFVTGGVAQVVGRVTTDVKIQHGEEKPIQANVDAYQRSGLAFAGGGVGAQYAVSKSMAMVLNVGAWAMFGEPAIVISPQLGATYGFGE